MQTVFVLSVMVSLAMTGSLASTKCAPCDEKACIKVNAATCLAGITKDQCQCCDICAKLEGQVCDLSSDYDMCGDGLECRKSSDSGSICQCKFQEILCGNDNRTYSNLCQLMATAVHEQRTNTLHVQSVGPCQPGARIITKPEYVRNRTNSNVVLQCEAMGLPTPSMTWLFSRADNQTFSLPGDDSKVVTSSRGGPGKFMITSWLQIEGLEKFHEGDYICVAFNQHHTDSAKARIKVTDS